MQFEKLRIAGFKSFVDPVEMPIESGLTGVVGPNGCGKSNILESIRWVMGANSAKAMRAEGMDEVIFNGSGGRPARSHAEVVLTIDNARGLAPAPFTDQPVLQISRRIDRGAGSTYRINGKEVRAKDVQLLFADASTGANSPALVRQGQISELIAAKPQNRRRILEEAAGVAGLHGRRHEAELRLKGAEANLERLADVAQELETALARLKREARTAEKYKRLSADIRSLQGAVHYARWAEARDGLERIRESAREGEAQVEAKARASAAATSAAIEAEQKLRPLRDEAAAASAIFGRLEIEKDRIEREEQAAAAEVQRLTGEIARIAADLQHVEELAEEARATGERLDGELAELRQEIAQAPQRGPELEAAAREAEARRSEAEARVEALTAAAAAAGAARRAAQTRVDDAASRLSRTQRAIDQARADRAAVGPTEDPGLEAALAERDRAQQALDQARAAMEAAELARAETDATEQAARAAAREIEDRLGALRSQVKGLTQLTASAGRSEFPPVLDQVKPARGFEAALAAALGEDLEAALDARAKAYWAGAEDSLPAWPAGIEPLIGQVEAPAQLVARLKRVGVVDASQGARLAKLIEPGCRLVSKAGDLWRWDGFVALTAAPRPAAVRLEQRNQLEAAKAELAALEPDGAQAGQAWRAAIEAQRQAQQAAQAARQAPRDAENRLQATRAKLEGFERERARREARLQSLDDTIARFDTERGEAEAALAAARQEAAQLADNPDEAAQIDAARGAMTQARQAASEARMRLDLELREAQARQRRLEGLERDRTDWARRGEQSRNRAAGLETERARVQTALERSREAPASLAVRRADLLDQLSIAEQRRQKASDALSAGETARIEADRHQRMAEAEAGGAREARAALAARLEAGRERLSELASALREATKSEPEALGRRLADEAVAVPPDAGGMEQHLTNLERERDQLGAVNLRAQEEAAEHEARLTTLKTERDDLTSAIAKLRKGVEALNAEGRERVLAAFNVIDGHFRTLFAALFGGGQAELRLVESDDPLEAGLEIFACPPGKRLSTMSLMSGGEQALTASALIFGAFLANPAPICVLDEVDAPLDDANVERYCNMLDEMRKRTDTRFVTITHNPVTMSRMDRLFGVTMPDRGVSQLVSVDLRQAEAMVTPS